MITGVSVTRPAALMTSISKRINFWPTVTWSPWATRLSKPCHQAPLYPYRWGWALTPSSETIPMACLVGKRTVTVPLTGEVNSPWLGSMTRPCPMTPDAKNRIRRLTQFFHLTCKWADNFWSKGYWFMTDKFCLFLRNESCLQGCIVLSFCKEACLGRRKSRALVQ